MERYLKIPVEGKPVMIEVDEQHLLEGFRRHLDCESIKTVSITSRFGLIVDEMGKIKDPPKPYNARATSLLGDWSPDWIAGDAILFAYGMRNGEPDIVPAEGLFT